MTVALCAAPGSTGHAANPDQIASFAQCRGVMNKDDRLACFDRTAMVVFGPDEALEQRRAEHERSQFGAGRREDRGGELREITASIRAIEDDLRTGEGVIVLDNGQVWQFLSDGRLATVLRSGMPVTIGRSSFGGYRLTVSGKQGFRGVRRLK